MSAKGSLGFVGYGRFGAALGSLFREAGHEVLAWDPAINAVPGDVRASSLDDLAARAGTLLVAVPVPEIRGTLEALRPRLTGEHQVFDVGSVKTGPYAAMDEILGAAVPWAGTHPLFGPVSLLRGERPLRVVVCASPLHPAAAASARALFGGIGCEVIDEAPAEHDRAMAWTHALAFFVAKGMLDAGAPADAPNAPPSFQAIARTIETVRADAGHLFGVLHRDNPFSAEARRALLNALGKLDATLGAPASSTAPPLSIPDLGAKAPDLGATRELIDEVDDEILALLSRRALLARRAGAAKASKGLAVRDPEREASLLEARRKKAEARGLDPDAVGEIFEAVLSFSRKVQER